MVNIQHYLISGRFITTMGHFIALLILFSTINNNINVSLSDNHSSTERITAVNTSWAALAIGFICFLLDFSGLFFGTSLFFNSGNMYHIFFHFIGGILLSWLITENWNYKALWPIIICCNFPTALYELWILFAIKSLKIILY